MDMIFSHAEQHKRHLERQKRLWAKPSTAEPVNRVPEPPAVKHKPRKKNMWEIFEMDFDAHVLDWHTLIRRSAEIVNDAENIAGRDELNDIEEAFFHRKRPIREIIAEDLDKYGVTWDHIVSSTRIKEIVKIRHLMIHHLHEERPDLSSPSLGRIFGGRDHTTILFAIRKVQASNGDKVAKDFLSKKRFNLDKWLEEVKGGKRKKGKSK